MVKVLETKAEFDDFKKANAKVAVDFTATWCGPCKMIGPIFEGLAAEYPDISFVKVDVDENAETAEAEGISAMPTFKFYHNGEMVFELVGASKEKLEEKLKALNEAK